MKYIHLIAESVILLSPHNRVKPLHLKKRDMSSPPLRLVVFCNGRSGSHLLGSYLDQHPEIHFDHEQFGGDIKKQYNTPLPYYFSRYLPNSYLKWRISKAEKPGYGLSFHLANYHHTSLKIQHLHAQGYHIIRLNRDDPWEQAMSHLVAFSSKKWHQKEKPAGIQESPQITLEPKKALSSVLNYRNAQKSLDKEVAPYPHLKLSYVDDLQRPEMHQDTMSRVFAHLGLSDIELEQSPFRKTYKQPYSEIISNYDELRAKAEERGWLETHGTS